MRPYIAVRPAGMMRIEQDLEEVREPRRVLERHRRVDVEEAAAVGAELLDRLLRGDRAERERLREPAERADVAVVARASAARPARHEHEPDDDRHRDQHVQQRADQVAVEVPELVRGAGDQAADQRDDDGDGDGGRDEVLHRQARHLREVRHRRLAAVVLPVGVGEERRGGVERVVPRGRREPQRVPRVQRLGAQDQVQQQPEQRAEDQDRLRVRLPVLAARRRARRACRMQRALDQPEVGHVAADRRAPGTRPRAPSARSATRGRGRSRSSRRRSWL